MECRRVRHGDYVRFLSLGKTGNRRAVKSLAVIDRLLKVPLGYRNAFQDAEYVDEPQLDGIDIVVLYHLEDIRFSVPGLRRLFCASLFYRIAFLLQGLQFAPVYDILVAGACR